MEHAEKMRILESMLEKTEPGRLQDWNERIGNVARAAGVKMESITWSKSPESVATDVLRQMEQRFELPALVQAVEDYQSE